ncbi:hypothetical protein [Blastococcus sp. CT_GayMR16]|uniref:hypothetical protein n=1 Tax=Blastococcus sp. CT_GayMR16 TaxID=2559607 RepID=UPI0010734C77|nr:hypothetical protein [Blastococcus sp. CT_GayMR16]TFV86291.1 hypothetical protein E4P38_17460 [Blastococcus sp. CT_GayMR16]
MTRPSFLRLLFAFLLAVGLSSCAGSGTGVDEAADAAAASAAEQDDRSEDGGSDDGGSDDGSQDDVRTDAATTGENGGGGRGGGPDPETGAGARPGGPFDVEAFEQIGQSAEEFLPFGREYCSGGRCTLVEERFDDPEAEFCRVSDFRYDPPARPEGAPASDQVIQRGTTVTVVLACPPEGTGELGTGEEGTGEEGTTDESTTDEGSSEEDGTDESTDDEGGTEDPPAEEPAG